MGQISRRFVLGAGLVTMATPRAARAAASGEIVLMAYSGTFQDNYTKAVVEPFMTANPSIKVIYNPGGNSAQMLGMLRAQRSHPLIDVDIMDFSVSRVANKEGLFHKFTPTDVPNMANIYDQAKMPGDWGPGITFDNLVMIYNPQNVKPAPTGIPDLLNPAHKGRIAFSPAPNVIGIALQLVVANYLHADYKASPDPEIDVLRKIAQNVQTWNAMPDNYTMVINGDIDIGIGWNARAQDYKNKAPGKIESITMQQGSILDMDTINLVEGSRNPDAALAFINYALSPEAQERFAKLMYYGPSNRNAKLPEDIAARTSSYPATLEKMLPVDWEYVASVQDQWSNLWRREVYTGTVTHADPGCYLGLRHVTKHYGTGPEVVSDCNLAVARGEFITLLGPSGCGKTTVLRIIAGLVPPSSGQVTLGGEDITARPAHARNIGLVFQNYALFPHLSVERNIAFGLDMRGIRGATARDRVNRALDLVRLGGLGARMPKELSGGQQQRVALARALVIEPAILLLDEPLSNLDAKLRDDLRAEIRDIQTRLGITALFVTHDQAEALTMSDRIAVISGGRIEQIGTPAEIYESPATPFVATFVGRTNHIAAAVQSAGAGWSLLAAPGLHLRAPAELVAGQAVTVMIRPHRMQLARSPVADTANANTIEATIRQVVFAGDVVHYTLDAAGTQLTVENPTASGQDSTLTPGESVFVYWPTADTLVFAHT